MEVHKKYVIISYCTCVFAILAFAAYAVFMYTRRLLTRKTEESMEQFITARGTMPRWRIAWSFFASAVGAWCITAPPSFAAYTGIIGLLMYALASGFPVLVIALFGAVIQRRHPDVCTIADFAGKRYGPVFRTFVACVCLFNMSIAMLAEYTTIGAIFKDFVGSVDFPIVIVVGVVTMLYTAYGGTFISIVTDQAQGIMTSIFITILVIYTAITFRETLPKPLPEYLAPNPNGYSAIFSMPCSLLAATVFSEAMWQKVWASQDRPSLIFGGAMGSLMIAVAVFLFGFGGWLAAWGGLIDFYTTNGNLYLFQVFASEQGDVAQGASAQVRSWVGVITVILAVTMNEAAIDSLQNGIAATFSNHFLKGQHSIFARSFVLLLNVPLIVISLQGFPVLQLFLITNMLTSCCFLPVALGLWEGGKHIISETASLFGCAVAMLTCTAYGIGRNWNPDDHAYSIRYGAWFTWYGNVNYSWDYFLVASGFSIVGMLMWIIPAQLLRRCCGVEGPGITGILRKWPGFRFITGYGLGFDLLGTRCLGWAARLLHYTPKTGDISFGVEGEPAHSSASGDMDPEMPDGKPIFSENATAPPPSVYINASDVNVVPKGAA